MALAADPPKMIPPYVLTRKWKTSSFCICNSEVIEVKPAEPSALCSNEVAAILAARTGEVITNNVFC
jgi:hypothetical protein